MDDQLKRLKKAMENNVFKNFSFPEERRRAVKEIIRNNESNSPLHHWDDETLLILLSSVQQSPKHGFDIITELYQKGHVTFKSQEGNLYTLLHHLENRGILTAKWEKESNKNRKYYSLTSKGHKILSKASKKEKNYSISLKQLLEGGTA